MPDAETLRRKETEAFKLYSCDSEELSGLREAGRLLTFPPFCVNQYPAPCLPHFTYFTYFWGCCERTMWLFMPCQIHWCTRETARKLFYTVISSKIAFLLFSCITTKSISD